MSTVSLHDVVRAAFNEEAGDLLHRAAAVLAAWPEDVVARASTVRELQRVLHTLKGASAAVGLLDVRDAVHTIEEQVSQLEPHLARVGAAEIGPVAGAVDAVEARLFTRKAPAQPGQASEPAEPEGAVDRGAETFLRVRPERIDALHNLVGELVVHRLQHEALAARVMDVRERAAEASSAWRRLTNSLQAAPRARDPRSTRELSSAVTSFSNTLAAILQDLQGVTRELPMLTAQSGAVSSSLEDGLRELRLMPLRPFFEEFGRVLRDAAAGSGRSARLVIRADGAEMDRSVLTRLREPMLHLVRNAVVHGIEPAAVRTSRGKAPTGTVTLEARCEGGRAHISVSDDGEGIDVSAIRRRAVTMGLADARTRIADDEVLDWLVRPGFSTREVPDALAGRGVGLDVVANAIAELDGRLTLEHRRGDGTTFTVEVPITASTSVGLVVRAGVASFGVLLSNIDRVLRIGAQDVRRLEGREVTDVDQAPVSVVFLADLLGVAGGERVASRKQPALLVRYGKQRVVVVVDDIPGEQNMVVKPFGRAFAGLSMFLGGAVQADGSIVPVLQIGALFESVARGTVAQAARPRPQTPAKAPTRDGISVLVVDDSTTMRTLLRSILHAARFAVTVAHDGRSALDELEHLPNCELVITDLQMPRMDGIELCKAIRRSPRRNIPVIMVTSVDEPAEKRRALDSGADAYIVKGDFEQQHFMDVVRRLIGRVSA